jgi:hypothetical protein
MLLKVHEKSRSFRMLANQLGATGHAHPHLQAAVNNYASLLGAMGRSQGEIAASLRAIGPELAELHENSVH